MVNGHSRTLIEIESTRKLSTRIIIIIIKDEEEYLMGSLMYEAKPSLLIDK